MQLTADGGWNSWKRCQVIELQIVPFSLPRGELTFFSTTGKGASGSSPLLLVLALALFPSFHNLSISKCRLVEEGSEGMKKRKKASCFYFFPLQIKIQGERSAWMIIFFKEDVIGFLGQGCCWCTGCLYAGYSNIPLGRVVARIDPLVLDVRQMYAWPLLCAV